VALKDSISAKAFSEEPREAWQVYQIKGFLLTGEHRHGCGLERSHVFPRLFERHRIILCDRRESEFDEEPQSAHQLVFLGDKGCSVFVAHGKSIPQNIMSPLPGTVFQPLIARDFKASSVQSNVRTTGQTKIVLAAAIRV
jgi:hypothetical protein